MGSTKLINLSISSVYLYYKNIFNNNLTFWYYYYFYFFINRIIFFICFDNLFIIFFKKKLYINILKKNKKNFLPGSLHLFKYHNWFIINIFLFINFSLKNFKNKSINIYFNKINIKKKMNYKNLI